MACPRCCGLVAVCLWPLYKPCAVCVCALMCVLVCGSLYCVLLCAVRICKVHLFEHAWRRHHCSTVLHPGSPLAGSCGSLEPCALLAAVWLRVGAVVQFGASPAELACCVCFSGHDIFRTCHEHPQATSFLGELRTVDAANLVFQMHALVFRALCQTTPAAHSNMCAA